MKKYIALKDNLERIYLTGKTKVNSYTLQKDKNILIVEHYQGFITVHISQKITIFYFFNETTERPFGDFIDITQNKMYSLESILKGYVKNTRVVIEGADGVGKSTLIAELVNKGYLAQDRAVKEVTQKMREEIAVEDRVDAVRRYLLADKNRKLVFLYLSDESELERRIFSRKDISEYDKKAIISQRLYIDTYKRLSDISNLYIIDCFGKTPLDLVSEIEKLI